MPELAPDLIELVQNEIAGIDAQFQFWITATFAVVVASHFARDQLGAALRICLAVLYILAVVLLMVRMGAHVEAANYLVSILADLQVDYPGLNPPIGWLRAVVMFLGSLAALLFILRVPHSKGSAAPREDAA